MKVINLTRKFSYNSVTLHDPSDAMSPEQVREFYATQYPELNNALVEGPVTKGDVATWTFIRAAGAKGRAPKAAPMVAEQSAVPVDQSTVREILRAIAQGERKCEAKAIPIDLNQSAFVGNLQSVANARRVSGSPINLAPQAFGVWG